MMDTFVPTSNTSVIFPSGNTAILSQTFYLDRGGRGRRAINFTSGSTPDRSWARSPAAGPPTASALVGQPSVTVSCPAISQPLQVVRGTATSGLLTVGFPATAQCGPVKGVADSAAADGQFDVNPYSLAVKVADASGAAPELATPAGTDGGGASSNLLLLDGVGALGLAALAQVAIGRRISQCRADATA